MAYTPFNPYQNSQYTMQMQQMLAQPQPQAQQQGGLSPASRPVGNREEANAVPADFSGAFMVFPDITHDRVYVKRWNYQTGTADFAEYARVVHQEPAERPQQGGIVFATIEDVNALRTQLNALRDDFAKLHETAPAETPAAKKGGKKDE